MTSYHLQIMLNCLTSKAQLYEKKATTGLVALTLQIYTRLAAFKVVKTVSTGLFFLIVSVPELLDLQCLLICFIPLADIDNCVLRLYSPNSILLSFFKT